MIFLPGGRRVILEIDGRTHYATSDDKADPKAYAATVKADRANRLLGYEVFRFGGYELFDHQQPAKMLDEFFNKLVG
ncbi:hypothetical protein [Kitasatospora sp. NPDC057936]|uniref:hypothetical protein n=1 Tax=Kitasatospora sp. NPDC057936 TaxID=3346283 RepID=UPI0036DE1492